MPKTQEELNHLKEEYKTLTSKLSDLSDDELNEVAGGGFKEYLDKLIEKGKDKHSSLPEHK